MIDLIITTKYCRGNSTTFPNRRNKLRERALPSAVNISRFSPWGHGVFVLVKGVFVLVHGVFVLVQGVFVLVHGVFVLVRGVLGLRCWVFVLETPTWARSRNEINTHTEHLVQKLNDLL